MSIFPDCCGEPKIKKYGLRGYLGLIGAATEQQGGNFVGPYSYYTDPMSHARLMPAILPVCDTWINISGDLGAIALISALAGQEELGLLLGGASGILWLYGRYIC
jgi:hypothetical protein